MKKVLLVIIILIIPFLFIKEKDTTVFMENNEEYNLYILSFENKEITTNNFEELFLNYKIIYIEPFISNLYQNKVKKLNRYYFDYVSINKNLELFKKKYITTLEENGYKKEALLYRMNGISINKIKVYCKEDDILKLKNIYNNLKYEKLYE